MAEKKPDEFNVLFGTPYGKSEKTVGPQQPAVGMDYFDKAGAVREYEKQEAQKKAMEPKPEPSYAKAIGSGIQKGALGVLNAVGDAAQLPSYAPSLAVKGASYIREKMGMPFSPEQKAAMEKEAELGGQAMRDLGPFGAKAIAAPIKSLAETWAPKFITGMMGLPTTEEMSTAVNPAAEKVFGVGPQYEPSTAGEKIAKSAFEYGLPSVIGGSKGVIPRTISGIGGAGASEAAGQAFEGTPYEPYARMVGAVLAPFAIEKMTSPVGQTGKRLFTPRKAAESEIGAGLGDYSAESSALAYQMSKSKDVGKAAAGMQNRIRNFTQNILGTNQGAPQYAAMVNRLGKLERDNVYDLVRSNPAAQAIDESAFGDLLGQDVFQRASENAVKNGANVPEWGIVPPQVVKGKPKTMIGPGGAAYEVPTPDVVQKGNLAYYDQVKRELDSIIEQAHRTGNTSALESAKNAKTKLLAVLDTNVPQYKDARGIAADTFLTASAPEAGEKFFTMSDIYGLDDFRNAFNSYNNEQKQAFRVGLMGRLEQELATKNPNVITNRFLNNPQFMEKFDFAFGPKVAGQIRSKVLAENMLQQAEKIRAQTAAAKSMADAKKYEGIKSAGIAGLATAGLAEATNVQFMLQTLGSLGISASTVGLGLGAALVTAAGQMALSATDRLVAKNMIKLIKSNDPADYAKLNSLIDKHPDVYPKMMTLLQAVDQATEAAKGQPEKPQIPKESVEESYQRLLKEGKIQPVRADGGRVARANGGQVSVDKGVRALMMAVEQAKKKVSQSTESLLEQPDEHIAQALSMAKRHI